MKIFLLVSELIVAHDQQLQSLLLETLNLFLNSLLKKILPRLVKTNL